MGKNRARARSELLRATPTSHGAQLSMAATALRAYLDWHLVTPIRCCEALAPVFIFSTLSPSSARTFTHEAQYLPDSRGTIAEREDAICNLPWTQTEPEKALAKCRRSQRALCAKKPQPTHHAVTDDEDGPWEDADESGARLYSHRVGIFLKHGKATHPRETILDYVQRAPWRHAVDMYTRTSATRCWLPTKNLPRALTVCHTAYLGVHKELLSHYFMHHAGNSSTDVVSRPTSLPAEPS